MSAEASMPQPEVPRRRLRVVKSNRSQIVLFSILTLILTAATVWGGRTWVRNSETLVFAVGEANGLEARFAARLATVLKNNSSRLQLKIVPNGDNAKALAQFDRRDANLAILRTDGKIPPARPHRRHPRSRRDAAAQPRRQEDQDHRGSEEKEDRRAGRQRKQRRLRPHRSRTLREPGRRHARADGAAGIDRSTSCSPRATARWSRSPMPRGS